MNTQPKFIFAHFKRTKNASIHYYFNINGSTKLKEVQKTHSHIHTDSNVIRSNSQ